MRRVVRIGGVTASAVLLLVLCGWASSSELYFSSDGSGQDKVTNVQEGSLVWMAVYDPDENVDSGVRDRFWTDAMVFDPNTGACLNWAFAPAAAGGADPVYGNLQPGHSPGQDVPGGIVYFEETGPSTGLFVSSQPLQIGTRLDAKTSRLNTHWVGPDFAGTSGVRAFRGPYASNLNTNYGQWDYVDGIREARSEAIAAITLPEGTIASHGRLENMDSLVGLIVDPDDPKDVAVALVKIIDTRSTLAWNQQIYANAAGPASITIVDRDENLDSSVAEYIPVFVLVNPGSWNPLDPGNRSANSFAMLFRYGGVTTTGSVAAVGPGPIGWFNIYDSGTPSLALGTQATADGSYYVQYPKGGVHTNVNTFDTLSASGVTRVMFYAKETGADTGEFALRFDDLCRELGFNSLQTGDAIVACYLDPNDEDDSCLGAANIGTREHMSSLAFTDASQVEQSLYWIGRDPVYVKVEDANANPVFDFEQLPVFLGGPCHAGDGEWVILDQTTWNSPVFFTNAGTEILPVWDAKGMGIEPATTGGYQLQLDNWKLEVMNEDTIYVCYNDVLYEDDAMFGTGDSDVGTAFPPRIRSVRVANDVSFDTISIGDTQVYNGSTTTMHFLDRGGNRVSGSVNSDCIFLEVVDPDQNEDGRRRERVSAFWDGGQNLPFGPANLNAFGCDWLRADTHPVDAILGDTNVFAGAAAKSQSWPMVYVLNPRTGQWAAVDLLETGVASGVFVSVICVDLVNPNACVPTLGVLPGDTLLAVYTDPSNHSDTAWIAVKFAPPGP
jgi:hypothetical protein